MTAARLLALLAVASIPAAIALTAASYRLERWWLPHGIAALTAALNILGDLAGKDSA